MSWDLIFKTVTNLLQLITMVGPLIDFIEMLFGKIFPGEKKGEEKKVLAMQWGRLLVGSEVGDEELSGIIEAEVAENNESGKFKHIDQNY